jgi:hypothetical protein
MIGDIGELSRYIRRDVEKSDLIDSVLKDFSQSRILHCNLSADLSLNMEADDECHEISQKRELEFKKKSNYVLSAPKLEIMPYKYCPKCGRRYLKGENVCKDCLVLLKAISDRADVIEIRSNPQFTFEGKNDYESFDELLSGQNLIKINEFDFTADDYFDILHGIKSQAFENFDVLVKENGIDFDDLDILEKIVLFAKSFVTVEYKSYGAQLGYFESSTIYIDDRQTDSLQITTMLHELSHFLMQEMMIRVICKVLDCSKNSFSEALAAYILSYDYSTQLIDEYAAHDVEGRFTLFGFQDYSSFLQIERNMVAEDAREEIEIAKTVGNTFAASIKEILESLIDRQLREEIKEQFLEDVLDRPNYIGLKMENCQILDDDGFIRVIGIILSNGCEDAVSNIDELISLQKK